MVAYTLGAGLVSFGVIYRLGPPSNPRTLNLIQWAMQLGGLATIVLSSYYQVESQAPLSTMNFPRQGCLAPSRPSPPLLGCHPWQHQVERQDSSDQDIFQVQNCVQDDDIKNSGYDADFKISSRPEYKLLTEEEFITQGVVETKKALDQLKEYCRSPESKPWQTVRKLQSPVR